MNFLIFLYLLVIAPKLLWDRVWKGKRHPGFLQRIGLQVPKTGHPVTWIHAVSVGEVKAAQPLLKELRRQEPETFFLITTTTATGQAEAKRTLLDADALAYLPIDLSWAVRRWVKKVNPQRFIFIESDFWPNLLRELKKRGVQIILASGKLSERSAQRFQFFSSFARRLFSHFDFLCVQNETHYLRFKSFVDPSRLHITGNLKLDLQPQPILQTLDLPQPALTISCTHPGEEELLLEQLKDYFLILAPRHPERFEEVAQLLARKNIPFTRWSRPEAPKRVLLVDTMGQLPLCYAHSRLAIVGGSYVDHIGGHNVLEPCLYGIPVIFGPYVFGQMEFASKAIEAGAGLGVPLSDLRKVVDEFFANPLQEKTMKAAALQLIESNRGAALKTAAFCVAKKTICR